MDMANYVLSRGGHPTVKEIKEVSIDWKDPKEAFEETYKHEQKVTELINELADVADAEKDRASSNFISKYIDEQVEEEQSVKEILDMFIHHDGHAVAQIDEKLGSR